MCKVTKMNIDGRTIRVADIKQKYMQNIADAARKCDYIDRVVLFGSSLEPRCKENSDIDLAVFGNVSKGKCLTSKQYERFLTQVFSYNNFDQAYDILYFKSGKQNIGHIMDDISKGETIYEA